MKLKHIFALLAVGIILNACKKKSDNPPDAPDDTPERDVINYVMTVNPRAENKTNKDTLIIKVNGNAIITSKGSVADGYQQYKVKTGDVIDIYYNPGKVTLITGASIIDENGLKISLDYNNTNNITLREYSCRCIASETVTLE